MRDFKKCFYCRGKTVDLLVTAVADYPVCKNHHDAAELHLLKHGIKVLRTKKFDPRYYDPWRL